MACAVILGIGSGNQISAAGIPQIIVVKNAVYTDFKFEIQSEPALYFFFDICMEFFQGQCKIQCAPDIGFSVYTIGSRLGNPVKDIHNLAALHDAETVFVIQGSLAEKKLVFFGYCISHKSPPFHADRT